MNDAHDPAIPQHLCCATGLARLIRMTHRPIWVAVLCLLGATSQLATAAPPALTLCTSETPFLPLSNVDPARPGRSQILLEMVAARTGQTIEHIVTPWKRCQLMVELGKFDAMNITGYAGINPTIAVFPMQDGQADTERSLGSVPSVLYRRVGSSADFVGGRILNTTKPVAVLASRQVNKDAIAKAGGSSEDGAKTVDALALKLLSGQVDLVASAEPELAELVASTYRGQIEALQAPLTEAHYYVVFSKQYYAAHADTAQRFWAAIAKVRADPAYLKKVEAIR